MEERIYSIIQASNCFPNGQHDRTATNAVGESVRGRKLNQMNQSNQLNQLKLRPKVRYGGDTTWFALRVSCRTRSLVLTRTSCEANHDSPDA